MSIIQGYKEEIFERLELTNFTSKSEIQDWLSGKGTKHEKKRSGYSNFATQLQEPFAIRDAVEITDDFDELKKLKKEAQSMAIIDNKTENIIQDKMDLISKELTKITEERKEERLAKEAEERDIIKQQKALDRTTDKIEKANTLGELSNLEGKLENYDKVDTSGASALINEQIAFVETQKELRLIEAEKAREIKEEMRRRIKETGEGTSPDF